MLIEQGIQTQCWIASLFVLLLCCQFLRKAWKQGRACSQSKSLNFPLPNTWSIGHAGSEVLLSPRLKVPVRQENILDLCFHFSAVKEDCTFRSIAGIVCSKRQVRKEERRGWVRHCAGCKRRHWESGWLALQALRGTICNVLSCTTESIDCCVAGVEKH